MGRGVVWCGSGYQRFLTGSPKARLELVTKQSRQGPEGEGGGVPGFPTKFYGRNTLGRLWLGCA
jgi:hypothetical protein